MNKSPLAPQRAKSSPEQRLRKLEVEAEIFAHVKVLERLQSGYEEGEFDESVYHRQLSASLRELFNLREKYERGGHTLGAFLAEQNLPEFLERVLRKVVDMGQDFSVGNHAELGILAKKSYKEFAAIASDLTASFITLLDCIKLHGVAQPSLLDEFFAEVIHHARALGLTPEFCTRIGSLRTTVTDHNIDLSETELNQLEHDVDLLFTEFQLNLKK